MKDVGAVHILSHVISVHFLYQNFDELIISVIGGKMESGKLFICRLISPSL